MRQLILATLAVGALAGGIHAQSTAPSSRTQASQATVEGCLQGGGPGGFTLVASDAKYTVVATEGVNLGAHVNHQVAITGTVEKSKAVNVLRASSVKMVATTCKS